jgi:hypothetical protein
MWNMKSFVIPANSGAIGIVTRGRKSLETIPGKHSVDYLKKKKTVLARTSHIMRKLGA